MNISMHSMWRGAVTGGLLACAISAQAQDTVVVVGQGDPPPRDTTLPQAIVEEVTRRFNASTTIRLTGRTRIPLGGLVEGEIGVLGGPLVVAGTIRGGVVVVNGDLELEGGTIEGDVLLVGGRVLRSGNGRITGPTRAYEQILSVRRVGELIEPTPTPSFRVRDLEPRATWRSGTEESYSTLTLATGGTYNRVEGLPIVLGPEIGWRTGLDLQFRIAGYGVLRTAGALSGGDADLGYSTRAEAVVGRRGTIGILGIRAFDSVSPIEAWQFTHREVGWATFFLHRDYRDYFGSKGWGGYAEVRLPAGLRGGLQGTRTSVTSAAAADPWSLLRGGEPWRPNPAIDEGHFTTITASLALDTRNSESNPTRGWFLSGRWELGLSGDVQERSLPESVRPRLPTDGSYRFHRLFVDLRRYARVSPSGRVYLRLLAGGWIAGDPLPVQHRLSLGGPDPLPGYQFRHRACNELVEDLAQPALCDRVLVAQAEFRTALSLGFLDRILRAAPWLGVELVDLVVFTGGGQAWLVGDGPGKLPSGRLPSINTWLGDFGTGIDIDGLGIYVAKAFTDGEPIRFLLRLDHRF
jgi:hypothetical protein